MIGNKKSSAKNAKVLTFLDQIGSKSQNVGQPFVVGLQKLESVAPQSVARISKWGKSRNKSLFYFFPKL